MVQGTLISLSHSLIRNACVLAQREGQVDTVTLWTSCL